MGCSGARQAWRVHELHRARITPMKDAAHFSSSGHNPIQQEHTDRRLKPINHVHDLRPPAPPDVWDYRAYSTWRDEVWKLIDDFVSPQVRKAFLASPPEYVVSDDLSWLDNIVYGVHGREVDSKTLLSRRLKRRYRAIRAVHGTRTSTVESYYNQGLLPLAPQEFHNHAREIFLTGEYPELSEAHLQAAIAAVGSDLRERRIFFEANEEMQIAHAGHYMLYGSEYLVAIAAHLGDGRDYRQVLKMRGEPTLFVCDVPFDLIGHRTLMEFAGDALESVFQELLDGRNFVRDPWRGAGFCIHEALSAAHLVGHYHPVIRYDPIGRWR